MTARAWSAAFVLAACLLLPLSGNSNVIIHPAPHPGQLLTTFTFVNNSGSTLPAGTPITMAQAFRYGDVMPNTHPVIRDATTHAVLAGQQWDEIDTFTENGGNGSWRHAVWAIDLPVSLANGATYQIEFALVSGAYSKTPVLALSALCAGVNTHDLKIHLTDIRNQNDTVRQSGEATFRLCDNITVTGGRDDPRTLDQGGVRSTFKVLGQFVYTNASVDPLLYAECNVDLYVDPATRNSLGDTSWVCWIHNSWQTVSAGNAGQGPGPNGLPNDPQVISYRPEVLDGSTSVLNWNGLDATVASASNPIQTTGCGSDNNNVPIAACLNIPSSTGVNAWYFGEGMRITSTGTPVGGLANNSFAWVYNNGSTNNNCADTNIVSLENTPAPVNATQILTSSQGTGNTTFSFRVWHTTRMSWAMMDTSLDDNWSPGGTTTRVTREVLPALTVAEKKYWEESGVITPIDVVDQDPHIGLVCDLGGDLNYHPFARANVTGGEGPGNRPDLGFPNDFAAQAWARGTANDWLLARLFSISETAYPYATLIDERTGRIPVLNNGPPGPGGYGIGNSYPVLGAPQTMFDTQFPSTTNPTDYAPPLQNVPNSNTNWAAGIWGDTGTGYLAHQPNFQGFTYAILGSRHYLDLLYFQGNRGYSYVNYGPGEGFRDDNLGGTSNHYYGLQLICCQTRGSVRALWDKVLPAALGGDFNAERQYYNDIITENGNYYLKWLIWKDGPGNSNIASGILAPDWPGSAYIVDTFITQYIFSLAYEMAAYLHAPMAANWLPTLQKFYEGVCGETLANHPVSFYCIDFSYIANIINAGVTVQGPNVGQYFNGTDAADFGSFSVFSAILTGGQLQESSSSYTLTNGDIIKFANGVVENGGFLIDQLPGNTWFTITSVDNTSHTYYVVCPIGHAVTSTCPTPGSPFTGFTRGGTPVSNETDENIEYRLQFDPGPGAGFADNTYAPFGKMIINGLQVAGFDVSQAQSITNTRWGNSPWGYTPSQWWDPTVAVPGLQ